MWWTKWVHCWLNWSEHWRLTVLDATVFALPVCVHAVWYGAGFHGKAETCLCTGSEVIQHGHGNATINLWREVIFHPLCRLSANPRWSLVFHLHGFFFFFFFLMQQIIIYHTCIEHVSFWFVWKRLGVNHDSPDDWCGGGDLHTDYWLYKFTVCLAKHFWWLCTSSSGCNFQKVIFKSCLTLPLNQIMT